MKSMPIHAVAQDIVDAVRPLMGERTIHVMETGGVIVASSDPTRIGMFHQGAAEAAANRRVVRIHPHEAHSYAGSGEGINLPVIKNGELLGVVGIFGVPDEVEQAASLLGACVDLYLDQALTIRKTQIRKDMVRALIRRILSGESADHESILAAGRELGVDLRLPMRVVIVAPCRMAPGHRHGIELLARMQTLAHRERWQDDASDVSDIVDDALVILKHEPPGFDFGEYGSLIHDGMKNALSVRVTVGIGGRSEFWHGLAMSHREARSLIEAGEEEECLSIDSPANKALYMLAGCLGLDASENYLNDLRRSLRHGFGEKDMERVLGTIHAYCRADGSIGRAAERLGIHKNTMNYRMNKIISLLGMENENAFVREFFLRLLLLRFRREGFTLRDRA